MSLHRENKIWKEILLILLFDCIFVGFNVYWRIQDLSNVHDTIDVGISFSNVSSAWSVAAVQDLTNALEKRKKKIEFRTAEGSLRKQKSDIEELLELEPDYLIIYPGQTVGLKEILEKASENTNIILFCGEVYGLSQDKIFLKVTGNFYEEGRLVAAQIHEKLGSGEKHILELQSGNGSSVANEIAKGFRDALCDYVGLEIKQVIQGLNGRSDTYREVISFLMDDLREVDAIFAYNDDVGIGAVAALEVLGLDKKIPVFSIGGIQDAINALDTGDFYSTVAVSPYIGNELAEQIQQYEKNEKYDKTLQLDYEGYTYENVEKMQGY